MAIGEIYERMNDRFNDPVARCSMCASAPKGQQFIHTTTGLCETGASLWKAILEFDTY
jgi:hypothetical protein